MITELDLNIYQTLFQQKKLTEKYLGKVKFDWLYSEIHYTAECTMGVPFDLFDKTIVGILLVDEVLCFEEIGDILGMNVINNPKKQQYRDDAEFDILRMALDNLYQYKMIEIGDTSYSSCRLTSIGKEYAQKGRKFKVESNKPFFLVYDHTSENHIEAKLLFKNLKGKNRSSLTNNFDYLDETLMKRIASKQANEVYEEHKGNSFTNPKINPQKSQSFILEIYVTLLYDLENSSIRLLAYEPNTKTLNEYFSKWLNENKLKEIVEQFQNENTVDSSLPKLPQAYVQTITKGQKDFELEVTINPEIAFAIAKKINQDLDSTDVEYFWNNLKSFVSQNTKEYWFFLPDLSGKCLSLIEKFADDCTDIMVFVTINATQNADLETQIKKLTDKSYLYSNNLFVVQIGFREIQKFKFWKLEDSLYEFNETSFSVGDSFLINSLAKTNIDTVRSYNTRKHHFAKESLPVLKEGVFQIINSAIPKFDISIKKAEILKFQNIDRKALTFNDSQETEDIKQQVESIIELKNDFISILKEKHQSQLKSELKQLITDYDKREFSKLEPLIDFNNKLQTIQSELFEDYIDLQMEVVDFEKKIDAEEKRIKDEILAKTYIIDTNVFIKEPDIISKIDSKHFVALSFSVIEELDKLKVRPENKENAIKAIRNINSLLKTTKANKKNRVRRQGADLTLLPIDLQNKSADNMILSLGLVYRKQNQNPVLLTLDKNFQSKAMMLDIPLVTIYELLGIKEEVKPKSITKEQNHYLTIFNSMKPDKNGDFLISDFISLVRKQNPSFDYKKLGFENIFKFILSLRLFKVYKSKYLKLK